MGDRKEPTPPPSAWRVPGDEYTRGATDPRPMNQLKPDPPPAPPPKAPLPKE